MDKLIKKILVEWSYRLDDGMIDLENYTHLSILREVLSDMKIPSEVIIEVMGNITEKEETKKTLVRNIKSGGVYLENSDNVDDKKHKVLKKNASKEDEKKAKDKKDGETKSKVNVFNEPKTDEKPTDTETKN